MMDSIKLKFVVDKSIDRLLVNQKQTPFSMCGELYADLPRCPECLIFIERSSLAGPSSSSNGDHERARRAKMKSR